MIHTFRPLQACEEAKNGQNLRGLSISKRMSQSALLAAFALVFATPSFAVDTDGDGLDDSIDLDDDNDGILDSVEFPNASSSVMSVPGGPVVIIPGAFAIDSGANTVFAAGANAISITDPQNSTDDFAVEVKVP